MLALRPELVGMDSAGGDELKQRIRGSTARGGDSKQRHSYYKCTAASVAVPDCSPKQQQGRRKQGVTLHYPLNRCRSSVEGRLEGRQRDIDHRSIHEGQGGAEDDGNQNPLAIKRGAGCCGRRGANLGTWRDNMRLGNRGSGHW